MQVVQIFVAKQLFLFNNIVIIDRSYNYNIFNNIKLEKLYDELVIVKIKDKKRDEKLKKNLIKSDNLN